MSMRLKEEGIVKNVLETARGESFPLAVSSTFGRSLIGRCLGRYRCGRHSRCRYPLIEAGCPGGSFPDGVTFSAAGRRALKFVHNSQRAMPRTAVLRSSGKRAAHIPYMEALRHARRHLPPQMLREGRERWMRCSPAPGSSVSSPRS